MIIFRWFSVATFALISWLALAPVVEGVTRRCWTCRSRGEYGDCKDPFTATTSNLDRYPGVEATPCATGWCGKVIESNDQDLTVATERICIPRPPDDNQERCADAQHDQRKVYMCFCMGDLCNGVSNIHPTVTILYISIAAVVAYWNFR
ncbi:hypothetical protein CHUAL_005075 [Chamberlinius hualienensis]